MIDIQNREECAGCSACSAVCPTNAIEMVADAMGFKYPKVNKELCINCGKCDAVCSWSNGYSIEENLDKPLVFATRHKSHTELQKSQSGAAFWLLAVKTIKEGGVVYGSMLDSEFKAIHSRATTLDECQKFRGSKYVQSDMGEVFTQVKADLKECTKVLFSGTPCQVAGLKATLSSKLCENLLLCDLVCHGTPSPEVWKSYLQYTEAKYQSKITEARFRDKQCGWRVHKESFCFESGSKIIADTFAYLFYREIMHRPSCGECRYTNTQRVSDITVADYWGIEKVNPDFAKDNKGCSLMIINTPKGEAVFGDIAAQMEVLQTSLQDCLQPQLQRPVIFLKKSLCFEQDFKAHGFEFVANKYGNIGAIYRRNMKIRAVKKFPGNTYRKLKKLLQK